MADRCRHSRTLCTAGKQDKHKTKHSREVKTQTWIVKHSPEVNAAAERHLCLPARQVPTSTAAPKSAAVLCKATPVISLCDDALHDAVAH